MFHRQREMLRRRRARARRQHIDFRIAQPRVGPRRRPMFARHHAVVALHRAHRCQSVDRRAAACVDRCPRRHRHQPRRLGEQPGKDDIHLIEPAAIMRPDVEDNRLGVGMIGHEFRRLRRHRGIVGEEVEAYKGDPRRDPASLLDRNFRRAAHRRGGARRGRNRGRCGVGRAHAQMAVGRHGGHILVDRFPQRGAGQRLVSSCGNTRTDRGGVTFARVGIDIVTLEQCGIIFGDLIGADARLLFRHHRRRGEHRHDHQPCGGEQRGQNTRRTNHSYLQFNPGRIEVYHISNTDQLHS